MSFLESRSIDKRGNNLIIFVNAAYLSRETVSLTPHTKYRTSSANQNARNIGAILHIKQTSLVRVSRWHSYA